MTGRVARWAAPLIAVLLVLAYATARRHPPGVVRDTRLLMDTVVSVSLWGVDEATAPELFAAAFAELEAVDWEMARQPGSPLMALNERDGGPVSPATGAVLARALEWARRTDGAFDPTTAPLLDLWDILAGPRPPPTDDQLAAALERVGWEDLELSADRLRLGLGGAAVDLGGIAKGYAIDRAAAVLERGGARNFLVNAGGDLFVLGSKGGKPWRVGIQHPRRPGELLQVVSPSGGALVTSGDYERSYTWDGVLYHHILDPRTGKPARECQSVTVWASHAIDADALATAVFVLGPSAGLALVEGEAGVEALVVTATGEIRESSGFRRAVPKVPRR